MTTRWLSDTEMRAWRSFISTTGMMMHALEADLAVHDLTLGDYEVLVRLADADDEALRMCDLAAVLQLSPSGLTRRLDGLVRSGYVDRVACEADRRVMYAHLTDAGRDKLTTAAPDHVASVRTHLLDALDPEQVTQMGDIFSILHERLVGETSLTSSEA